MTHITPDVLDDALVDIADWFNHLIVRRNQLTGLYPHPGLWLTRGDSYFDGLPSLIQAFDISVVAPFFCQHGFHRWISTSDPADQEWNDHCWYCGAKPEDANLTPE